MNNRTDSTEAAPLDPERAAFEAWAIQARQAIRTGQHFWFHRNGGDGLFEAWLAGAASRSHEPVEISPEFTDTARAALLWVLWHHQGGSSAVSQPIRFALGMGVHDELNAHKIAEAKRWAALTKSTTEAFHQVPKHFY